MKHLKKIRLAFLVSVGFLTLPSLAMATGVLGGSLIVQNTGDVTVAFGGSSASYTSTLSLFSNGNLTPIFSTNASTGQTLSLGTFDAGTTLTFGLTVHDTGNVFFTGAGANNIDGIAHATVENLITGSTIVGFEDLLGGGDRDYNDLIFYFSNTQTNTTITQGQIGSNVQGSTQNLSSLTDTQIEEILASDHFPSETENPTVINPEPSTIVLLGSGLLGLGAWRLRRKSA